jgi:hypothetical protein
LSLYVIPGSTRLTFCIKGVLSDSKLLLTSALGLTAPLHSHVLKIRADLRSNGNPIQEQPMSDIQFDALSDQSETKDLNAGQVDSDAGRLAWKRPSLRRLDLGEAELNVSVGDDGVLGQTS